MRILAQMITPADERRHRPGPGRDWEESWYLDFVDAGGTLAGFVRLTLRPAEATAWFWAGMVGGGPKLVVVRDHEVPPPAPGGLEVRAPGLWTELVCETPLDHWSVGLEAFGVALDDPLEAWGRERGDPWALGLDVEWEGAAPPAEWPGEGPGSGVEGPSGPGSGVEGPSGPGSGVEGGGYWQGCAVHGDVLVGAERFALDGAGTRVHRWGDVDRSKATGWAAGRREDGSHFLVAEPAVECDPESRILRVFGEVPAAHVPVLLPGAGRLDRAVVGSGWAEWFSPSAPA